MGPDQLQTQGPAADADARRPVGPVRPRRHARPGRHLHRLRPGLGEREQHPVPRVQALDPRGRDLDPPDRPLARRHPGRPRGQAGAAAGPPHRPHGHLRRPRGGDLSDGSRRPGRSSPARGSASARPSTASRSPGRSPSSGSTRATGPSAKATGSSSPRRASPGSSTTSPPIAPSRTTWPPRSPRGRRNSPPGGTPTPPGPTSSPWAPGVQESPDSGPFSDRKRFELKAGDHLERAKAPAIQGRPFTIEATFEASDDHPDGVIVAQGGTAHGLLPLPEGGPAPLRGPQRRRPLPDRRAPGWRRASTP